MVAKLVIAVAIQVVDDTFGNATLQSLFGGVFVGSLLTSGSNGIRPPAQYCVA